MTSFTLSNPGAPPPTLWFYLVVAMLLLWAVAVAIIAGRLRRVYTQSRTLLWQELYDAPTAPHGVSDQPTAVDSLKLGVAPVVARLFMHPQTNEPYTVALSGGWGSGKSSVMKQIEQEMRDANYAFQAVPVNVWHFQQEDQLLTWFLSQILNSCNNWRFRMRQVLHNLRTLGFTRTLYRALVLALAFPVLLYVGVALAHGLATYLGPASATSAWMHTVHHGQFGQWMARLMEPAFYVIGHLDDVLRTRGQASPKPTWTAMLPELSVVFAVVTLVGSVGTALKRLPSLVRPLLDLIPYQQQYEVAQGTAGFRQRYQQDFGTIIRNATGKTLVIFVDDIDRISGPRVLELLETLNFIVTSAQARRSHDPEEGAKLYFILAMNVPEVVRVLGPVLDAQNLLPTDDDRAQLAASYLAKLVDLTVRIPSLRDRNIDSLFVKQ